MSHDDAADNSDGEPFWQPDGEVPDNAETPASSQTPPKPSVDGSQTHEPLQHGGPDSVELPPPDFKTATFGTIQEVWRQYRHRKKQRKLARKGYVQWILVNGTYPTPKFVKPDAKGGGIYEYKRDGERYLFPKEAMLPSEREGMWTIVHREGEADPINLRDPSRHAIRTDELEEYLQQRVTSSPPSWFDNIDIDAEDAIKYAIAAIIVFALVQNFMGGGF